MLGQVKSLEEWEKEKKRFAEEEKKLQYHYKDKTNIEKKIEYVKDIEKMLGEVEDLTFLWRLNKRNLKHLHRAIKQKFGEKND